MTNLTAPVGHDKQKKSFQWWLNNGPAIATMVGSVALALAASFLDLSELRILQAIVALLALIGTSLLTERLIEGRTLRQKLSTIDERLDQVLLYTNNVKMGGLDSLVIRRRDLRPLEERLNGAKRVSILGGSLFRLINEYQRLFEQLAESGCRMRFLMTDPKTAATEFLSSAVVYESSDIETYRTQMQAALSGLLSLSSRYRDVFEVRLFAFAPPFSLVVVEKGTDSSTIQVELYPFRLPARDRPTLVLDRERDPRLHAVFASQYEAIWSSSFSRTADAALPLPASSSPPQTS
jgi:hypothetical protein